MIVVFHDQISNNTRILSISKWSLGATLDGVHSWSVLRHPPAGFFFECLCKTFISRHQSLQSPTSQYDACDAFTAVSTHHWWSWSLSLLAPNIPTSLSHQSQPDDRWMVMWVKSSKFANSCVFCRLLTSDASCRAWLIFRSSPPVLKRAYQSYALLLDTMRVPITILERISRIFLFPKS